MSRSRAGGLLTVALALAFAAPAARAGEISTLPTRKRVVALTFDAGSTAVGGWSILRTLQRDHASGTFFLTGQFARTHPLLSRVIARSYPVGNHTYDHPHLTRLASGAVAREIGSAAAWIRRITGRDPRPLFRFPYGDSDIRTIAVAERLGYVCVRWTVDTLGWEGGQPAGAITSRVLAGLRPGEIVLMHVGAPDDAAALPAVIAAVRAHGYRFVTLARLKP